MERIDGLIKQQFIPTEVVSFFEIQTSIKLFENDVFTKYHATTQVNGEYIVCNDTRKLKTYSTRICKESYDEYLEFISKRNPDIDRWIYNIIDGISEQEAIIHKDDLCIVIPTYNWDGKNVNKLHIMCLPVDKNLRSIRDLTCIHISLLEHMRKITIQQIEEKYGLKEDSLKMFFHYDPSTYHLHIHFMNTSYTKCNSSVEYSHDLDSVIFNLKIDTDYYKKIKLNKHV
jgi:diadenosine tetraphosphate (Ap4A) HIT family hydrolase